MPLHAPWRVAGADQDSTSQPSTARGSSSQLLPPLPTAVRRPTTEMMESARHARGESGVSSHAVFPGENLIPIRNLKETDHRPHLLLYLPLQKVSKSALILRIWSLSDESSFDKATTLFSRSTFASLMDLIKASNSAALNSSLLV